MERTGPRPKNGKPSSPASTPVENAPPVPERPLRASRHKLVPEPEPEPLGTRSQLSVAFRYVRPNWRNYIEFVDLAARNGHEGMDRFRKCYRSLSAKQKQTTSPEDLCDLANVTPDELVAEVCRELWKSGRAESSMISSIAMPAILERTIELAQDPENHRDRERLFRSWGMLPDKSGNSINIYANSGVQAAVELPSERAGLKLKTFDEESVENSRILDVPSSVPYLVSDVPSEDN